MYCSQCGKKIPQTSKYCSGCGCPIIEEELDISIPYEPTYDVVKDIKTQLSMIDGQKKPSRIKNTSIQSALETVKSEAYAAGLVTDKYAEKKQKKKKELILDFPLPHTVEELLAFAKYIESLITSKKKNDDPITEAWKEKLKQIYRFAKKEFATEAEFIDIQRIYKEYKRRERHTFAQPWVWLLFYPIVAGIIMSIVEGLPFLLFASCWAMFLNIFLTLYVHNLLDKMILSIKKHSNDRKSVPKLLRIVAWFLLTPALAALITSIVYYSVGLIVLFAVLFGVDALFLFGYLCEIYDF